MIRVFGNWLCLVLLSLLLFSQPENLTAQDETTSTNQLWLFWHHNQYFTHRFSYTGDIGYRQEFPYDNWRRIHFRPGVQWSAGSLIDLAGGVGFWYTGQKSIPNAFEIRPWQGAKLHWPTLGRFNFDHYLRLEQRFNHYQGDDSWTFVVRSRYRLNVVFPINNPGIIDKTLFVRMNAEFFLNLGKSIEERFVDDRRYTMGLGYRFDPKWRIELLYVIEQSKAYSSDGFKVNSHIFQIRLRTYILAKS